jgi:hypothetical protein
LNGAILGRTTALADRGAIVTICPDLNLVEFAWGNIQGKELANLCSDDLGAMVSGVRNGFARVYKNKSVPQSFLQDAGISFSDPSTNYTRLID